MEALWEPLQRLLKRVRRTALRGRRRGDPPAALSMSRQGEHSCRGMTRKSFVGTTRARLRY